MNIGIIIFIISVIITGVSALRDKSHEDRQNQRPNQKTSNEQHQEGGFFEKLEKTFQEISDELNDEPEKRQSKPFETSLPPLNEDWNENEKRQKLNEKNKKNHVRIIMSLKMLVIFQRFLSQTIFQYMVIMSKKIKDQILLTNVKNVFWIMNNFNNHYQVPKINQ